MNRTRRSLIVLVAGALTGILAFGVVASGAWFTDQDSIVGNSVAAGTLSIDLRDEDGGSMPFSVGNMAPGGEFHGPFPFGVYNDGSLPLLYDISVGNIVQTTAGFKNKVNARLISYFGGAFVNDCNGTAAYDGPLSGLAASIADAVAGSPQADNTTQVWKICFALDESAGNQYQGASATFDIVVDAYQPESVSP